MPPPLLPSTRGLLSISYKHKTEIDNNILNNTVIRNKSNLTCSLFLIFQILKFARHGSYVSLDRSIVLGVDDLPDDWMSLIYNLNRPDAYFGDLPKLEKRLSQQLGNATISGPSDTPIRDYKNRLITLADRLWMDEKSMDDDEIWSKLRFVIENDACGLMMLENGLISVPYNITSESLFEFLEEHGQTALELAENYEKMNSELKSLRRQCVEKWKLESIELGENGNLSQHALRSCLERLLALGEGNDRETEELKSMLKGHRLYIGPQEAYVVLPDGRLSIPCDWKL